MTGKSALLPCDVCVTEALRLDRLMHWLSKVRAAAGNTDLRKTD
jgi:hypothetical protein